MAAYYVAALLGDHALVFHRGDPEPYPVTVPIRAWRIDEEATPRGDYDWIKQADPVLIDHPGNALVVGISNGIGGYHVGGYSSSWTVQELQKLAEETQLDEVLRPLIKENSCSVFASMFNY